jgi:hypothetical protein
VYSPPLPGCASFRPSGRGVLADHHRRLLALCVRTYEIQLSLYARAERTAHSIYLIVRVHDGMVRINQLLRQKAEDNSAGKKTPEVIVVDGRRRESASRRGRLR